MHEFGCKEIHLPAGRRPRTARHDLRWPPLLLDQFWEDVVEEEIVSKFAYLSEIIYICIMTQFEIYKGINPSIIIMKMLERKNMTQKQLAEQTGIQKQTLNAILKNRREIPISLSIRLDEQLGFDTGFFAILQAYYTAENLRRKALAKKLENKQKPLIRPVVFWDVDIDRLDWASQKDFIMERVLSRGSKEEIKSVKQYYE